MYVRMCVSACMHVYMSLHTECECLVHLLCVVPWEQQCTTGGTYCTTRRGVYVCVCVCVRACVRAYLNAGIHFCKMDEHTR